MDRTTVRPFRIGILGGMGPLAGVHLQRLIIEATPATKDQDHLQVVCFTNPQIPDRTASLLGDDRGTLCVAAIQESLGVLARAGVDVAVIPCNTVHARFEEIQRATPVPIVDMVALAAEELYRRVPAGTAVGLLTTDGARAARLYEIAAGNAVRWVYPDDTEQRAVMDVIYGIKAGKLEEGKSALARLADVLRKRGAEMLVLGCTELSLCADALESVGYRVIDPLRIVATHVVALALDARGAAR